MSIKRRKLPLEVSSWMEKDLKLKKITANARLLTNDTRQNIMLSRQFFSDLLYLSYSRYRKISEYDFDKKIFLKNQLKKSESSMPGLRPYVNQTKFGIDRVTSSRIQSVRKDRNSLLSPSTQSLLSPGTKSDPTFDRRQQQPLIRSAQAMRARHDITPLLKSTIPTNQRPQISRETLNRLAQPKGFRYKSVNSDHTRSNTTVITTSEDLFGKIDETSEILLPSMPNILPKKPKTAVDDKRFHELVGVFSKVYETQTTNLHTFKSIVQANKSLQDDEGHWKTAHPSVASHKTELKHHRQMLAEKLHNKTDMFLIDVGA